MSSLPKSTILGTLSIIEVYEYYDQPCLFSCKNLSGQIFIAVWVDSLEEGDIWLYAPVSSKRFDHIKKGLVDLRSIFTNSEDAFVYEVFTSYKNLPDKVKPVDCREIEEEYLPEEGQIIDNPSELVNVSFTELVDESISQIAKQKNREVINFILELKNQESNEAPVGDLGEIIKSLQNAISRIGQAKEGRADSKKIPLEIIEKTTLVTSKVFSGSFGMQIEGLHFEQNLFGDSLIGMCIEELILLINIGANPEDLRARLSLLKKESAVKYRIFLEALESSGIQRLHIDWASPTPGKGGRGEISFSTIEEAITIINNTRLNSETPIIILVKIVMIQYETKKITLKDIRTKKKYRCEIADGAISDVETISKTPTYIAEITDFLLLSPIIEKETHEYELLSLKIYEANSTRPSIF
jgi:hypothetical protein